MRWRTGDEEAEAYAGEVAEMNERPIVRRAFSRANCRDEGVPYPPFRAVKETVIDRYRRDELECGHYVFTYLRHPSAKRRRCEECARPSEEAARPPRGDRDER